MFTGIVQDVGRVQAREERGGDVRLTIAASRMDLTRIAEGDSMCVQGCCVTALGIASPCFQADLSRETLALTTLGELRVGSSVNLEPALRAAPDDRCSSGTLALHRTQGLSDHRWGQSHRE